MLVQNATFEAQLSRCYPTCFWSVCQPPVQNQSELHLPQEKNLSSHKDPERQHCLTCCWSRDAHSFAPTFTQCWAFLLGKAFVVSEGKSHSHVFLEMYWASGTQQLLDTLWDGDNKHVSPCPWLVIRESDQLWLQEPCLWRCCQAMTCEFVYFFLPFNQCQF